MKCSFSFDDEDRFSVVLAKLLNPVWRVYQFVEMMEKTVI